MSTANVPDLASPIELDERYRTGHKPTTNANLCKQQGCTQRRAACSSVAKRVAESWLCALTTAGAAALCLPTL